MARLDRLGPAKEVAQIGSVIGREFSHDLLALLVDKPQSDFHLALDHLVSTGLLFRYGLPPDARYLFKHALLRDAAYSTLLRSRRQELHRRIVCVLRQDFPELVVTQPELLAQHCSEGGMVFDAIEYYVLASQRATAALNTVSHRVGCLDGWTCTHPWGWSPRCC
jgi:predicted ATPase